MTFQQSLDLAELEADMAFEKYLEAFDEREHPEVLVSLTTQIQMAQERYNKLIEDDLAQ